MQLILLPNPYPQYELFRVARLEVDGFGVEHAAWHGQICVTTCWWCHHQRVERFAQTLMGVKEPVFLDRLFEPVVSVIGMRFPADNGTAAKCVKHLGQLFMFLNNSGVEHLADVSSEMLDDFYWMATSHTKFREPSASTAANRQWAVRTMFVILADLGLWAGPDICGESISRNIVRTNKPATTAQLRLFQVMSQNVLLPNGDEMLVALALCGGDAKEIAQVRANHIDLQSHTIRFEGDSQRVNPIGDWSHEIFRETITKHDESDLLVVQPGLTLGQATHSVTVRLHKLVKRLGLTSKAGLTGESIRLGAAKQVLEAHGLEEAARFLGNQSLDTTAKTLGYQWWTQN